MLQYTKSSLLDTLYFFKESIYYSNLVIQLFYIIYLVFRIYFQMGYIITNSVLLFITAMYLVYYILFKKEFYTIDDKKMNRLIKRIVKWLKRSIYIYLIVIAVHQLIVNPLSNDNLALLMTVFMIIGFIMSFILDNAVVVVDNRIELVKNSFLYDAVLFKDKNQANKFLVEKFMNKNNLSINEITDYLDDKKVTAVKMAHHRQKIKAMRKRTFRKSKKH